MQLPAKQFMRWGSDVGSVLGGALRNHTCRGVKEAGLGKERSGTVMLSPQSQMASQEAL